MEQEEIIFDCWNEIKQSRIRTHIQQAKKGDLWEDNVLDTQ